MNKTAAILFSAAAITLVGCGDSQRADNPEPAVPVQGKAIAKLEVEPKPVEAKPAEAKPETKTAPAEMKPATTPAVPAPAPQEGTPKTTTPAPAEATPPAPATTTASAPPAPAPKVTTTNAPAKPVEAQAELIDGEFLAVGFDKLSSFEYEVPEEEYDPDKKPDPKAQPDQIPEAIKAFNKKRVALKGFMLPLKVEDGNITELLIMRDQSMCCYGTVPKINEWVSVKMTGKGVKPIMDQAVTIYGRLKVGEVRENGYLVGIYEMDGEKLTGPLDL